MINLGLVCGLSMSAKATLIVRPSISLPTNLTRLDADTHTHLPIGSIDC